MISIFRNKKEAFMFWQTAQPFGLVDERVGGTRVAVLEVDPYELGISSCLFQLHLELLEAAAVNDARGR